MIFMFVKESQSKSGGDQVMKARKELVRPDLLPVSGELADAGLILNKLVHRFAQLAPQRFQILGRKE